MAQITDIKERFIDIVATITDIPTFKFDTLSTINSDRDKTYPVLLLNIPEKAVTTNISDDWKDYNIEFFLMDLNNTDDTRLREEVWDELQTLTEQVLIELKSTPGSYRIKNKEVNFDYGYDILNDKLVVVKCSFVLSAFHCYTAFVPTGTYTYEMVMALTYEQLSALTYNNLAA